MKPENIYRFIRFVIVTCIIIAISFILFYTAKVTYPFIIGFAIAFMINPIVNFLQHRIRFPRAVSVLLTMIAIVSIFAGLITLLVTELLSGANYLSNHVPRQLNVLIQYSEQMLTNTLIPFYEKITGLFNTLDTDQQNTIIQNIQNIGTAIANTLGDFIQNFFQNIPTIISWFPNAATVLIFSALATFFISNDWYRLQKYINALAPKKIKESSGAVILNLKKALFGFIKAQLTLVSITTVIVLLGLLILRVEYAITIALVIGLVDILPYLGSGTIFVPWILYEAFIGEVSLAIGLGILYIVVIVQRQIMEPKVLSSSIGLDPLATLISLFVGFKLLGFLGLIIGPVVLVVLNTLHKSNVFKDIWTYIKGDENKI